MKKKAIIISIKSYKLTFNEKKLIATEKPWGLILFKRNIKSFKQISRLTKQIRKLSKDPYFPILIDEEGANVSRLKKIINHRITQKLFGDLYKIDKKESLTIYKKYLINLSYVLKKLGININTIPVLDVLRNNTNKIIGNRSFSNNPAIVSKLGKICVAQLKKEKLGTVLKHIPGHGCSKLDSHLDMPKVNASLRQSRLL